jgi:hypothetical protein
MGGVGGRENTPPSLHTPFGAVCQLVWEVSPLHDRVVQLLLKKEKTRYFWSVVFPFDEIVPHVVLLLWCSTMQSPRPRYCHPCGGKRAGVCSAHPQSAEGKFFFFFLPWRGHIIIATIPCPLCPCLIAGIKNPRDFHRNGHYNYPISSPSGSLSPPYTHRCKGIKKNPQSEIEFGSGAGENKKQNKIAILRYEKLRQKM